MPLTAHRAKPAVPFGGLYRLVDFALSNVINSHYLHVIVLTQYKSHSLDRHVSKTWRMSPLLGNYVAAVPAQQRVGKHWYLGSADAIYQCLNIIDDERPDIVVVVGADHVYRMDFSQMVDAHIASGAEFTVAAIRQPIEEADQFGVIEIGPERPDPHRGVPREADRPGRPGRLPRRDPRVDGQLRRQRRRPGRRRHRRRRERDLAARHGRRHRPVLRRARHGRRLRLPAQRRARARRRATATTGATWGRSTRTTRRTPDLISIEPVFNLYNDEWPLFTRLHRPAARQVRARGRGAPRPRGRLDRLPRRRRLRRDRLRVGPVPRRPAALVGAGHRLGAHGRRARRAATRRCTARSSTRTSSSPSAPASAWTTSTTSRAVSRSRESGITVVPKGTVITD